MIKGTGGDGIGGLKDLILHQVPSFPNNKEGALMSLAEGESKGLGGATTIVGAAD